MRAINGPITVAMSHTQSIAAHFHFDLAKLSIPFFVLRLIAHPIVSGAIFDRGPDSSINVILSGVSAAAWPAGNVVHGEMQKSQVDVSGGDLVNQLPTGPRFHRAAGTGACVR